MSDSNSDIEKVPTVKIVEEPLSRSARFRYKCEGRYSGTILGVNSTATERTYPSIQIENYNGPAFVVVSCVCKEPPYRPHPHNLVGKTKNLSQGICYFKIPPNKPIINFPSLGIQCVKRKDIDRSLTERERLKVDPFKTGFDHKLKPENVDLNCVRLCFQVFLEGGETNNFNVPLDPVVSNPIYDKKAAAELQICWISHASASVAGGKVICMLCDKIAKDDIQVRFYSEDNSWEAIAKSTSPHYHKQVAIIFKSPTYRTHDIDEPVTVKIQLRRPSDGEVSKPVSFQLLPLEAEDHDVLRRKRKKLNESPKSLVIRHMQAEVARNEKLNTGVNNNNLYNSNVLRTESSAHPFLPIRSIDSEILPKTPFHSQPKKNFEHLSGKSSISNGSQNPLNTYHQTQSVSLNMTQENNNQSVRNPQILQSSKLGGNWNFGTELASSREPNRESQGKKSFILL